MGDTIILMENFKKYHKKYHAKSKKVFKTNKNKNKSHNDKGIQRATEAKWKSSQWPKLKPFEQQNKGELGYHPKYKTSIQNFLMD